MIHNNNCDGDKCKSETGEVRKLPLGGGSNLILCRACFDNEIRYRKQRNAEGVAHNFETPAWEDCEVYDPGE